MLYHTMIYYDIQEWIIDCGVNEDACSGLYLQYQAPLSFMTACGAYVTSHLGAPIVARSRPSEAELSYVEANNASMLARGSELLHSAYQLRDPELWEVRVWRPWSLMWERVTVVWECAVVEF